MKTNLTPEQSQFIALVKGSGDNWVFYDSMKRSFGRVRHIRIKGPKVHRFYKQAVALFGKVNVRKYITLPYFIILSGRPPWQCLSIRRDFPKEQQHETQS